MFFCNQELRFYAWLNLHMPMYVLIMIIIYYEFYEQALTSTHGSG